VCRAAVSVCDVAESCNGGPQVSLATSHSCSLFANVSIVSNGGGLVLMVQCPTDTFAPSSVVCGTAVDLCDVAAT
jgi:hypothetical protein